MIEKTRSRRNTGFTVRLKIHNMNTKTQPGEVTELRRQGEEGQPLRDSGGMGSPRSSLGGHGGACRVPAKEGFPKDLIKRWKPFQLCQERHIVHEKV